jgi:DNA-binding response OmpR family regulator
MSDRSIKLLHVEDDAAQQILVGHYLKSLSEFHFDVHYVDNEEEAVAEFSRGDVEFVLLDYHLAAGDGLSCLRRLRQRDILVPIVVISGMATPEVTAELLRFGADDYLPKRDLNSSVLGQSIRTAYRRAEGWRELRLGMGA